jgi:hypothetical protein
LGLRGRHLPDALESLSLPLHPKPGIGVEDQVFRSAIRESPQDSLAEFAPELRIEPGRLAAVIERDRDCGLSKHFQNSRLDYFIASMYKLAMKLIIPEVPVNVKGQR